jgi:hypothetical protein
MLLLRFRSRREIHAPVRQKQPQETTTHENQSSRSNATVTAVMNGTAARGIGYKARSGFVCYWRRGGIRGYWRKGGIRGIALLQKRSAHKAQTLHTVCPCVCNSSAMVWKKRAGPQLRNAASFITCSVGIPLRVSNIS